LQSISDLRMQARSIWQAGVDAVLPEKLVAAALSDRALGIAQAITQAPRILVVGGGKAGAGMSAALETALAKHVSRIEGIVNVPESCVRPLQSIRLHAARPAGSNEPTTAGVTGAECMLELVSRAGPEDVAICLLSGGGSALMPAPVQGVSLADKQKVTRGLHAWPQPLGGKPSGA
jgi:hydroxypyruvate reductase/glycerate 2-kinase